MAAPNKIDLREGYPEGDFDFAWPVDYPYDAAPVYADGPLFTPEEREQPINDTQGKEHGAPNA